MLLEKYHTPLFDYSEEIKNLYKFIILEMKKKLLNILMENILVN